MENPMKKNSFVVAVAALAIALAVAGCDKIGPKKKNEPPPPVGGKNVLYEPDMSKPDGPMLQVLRGAQDRDENLIRASFAPEYDLSRLDDASFKQFRRKVLLNRITPVPESVENVGPDEAIVKARNGKGKEVPIHVKKYGDKWLITDIQFGRKFYEKHPSKGPGQGSGSGSPAGSPAGAPAA